MIADKTIIQVLYQMQTIKNMIQGNLNGKTIKTHNRGIYKKAFRKSKTGSKIHFKTIKR